MEQKVQQIETPTEQPAFVAFDPFSAIVIEHLNARRDLKNKLRLFNEIITDDRALSINDNGKCRTILFPGNNGEKTDSWEETKQMAIDINNNGESVIFLPEFKDATSADALVLFGGKPVVADFKYSGGTNWNTLQKDLEHGFEQARTIVLKLSKMDTGQFQNTIDYLVRNVKPIGNIKLLNEYGKMLEITSKELRYGAYKKKIKGFL